MNEREGASTRQRRRDLALGQVSVHFLRLWIMLRRLGRVGRGGRGVGGLDVGLGGVGGGGLLGRHGYWLLGRLRPRAAAAAARPRSRSVEARSGRRGRRTRPAPPRPSLSRRRPREVRPCCGTRRARRWKPRGASGCDGQCTVLRKAAERVGGFSRWWRQMPAPFLHVGRADIFTGLAVDDRSALRPRDVPRRAPQREFCFI